MNHKKKEAKLKLSELLPVVYFWFDEVIKDKKKEEGTQDVDESKYST